MTTRKLMLVFFLALFTLTRVINSKPGCMDNSYHLKQKFDPKEWHEVECNCPCDYYAMRGLKTDIKSKCLECDHAHNPGPNPYTPEAVAFYEEKLVREEPCPFYCVQKLIMKYKAGK